MNEFMGPCPFEKLTDPGINLSCQVLLEKIVGRYLEQTDECRLGELDQSTYTEVVTRATHLAHQYVERWAKEMEHQAADKAAKRAA